MNIKEAKKQIENAMVAYFSKDAFGNYRIPIERQRPIFLMGPPGIGKTAIMSQVASNLGVGLVSYSMTHHTRQSALGLPFIETKIYGGKEYEISEHTMSEIIASVYEMMEETGLKEGILFLDEVNCVSETLAPSMLQFLQFKIFGRHRVPDGWIVVTAGNPPEYNNSVREFDIVTWDRLKRIDVEPNYDVWKEYAYKNSTHASITSYLSIKKAHFYKIENTVDGKSFVTARGWSDLSDVMKLYEENDIIIDEKLIIQYLQNRKIAKDFAIYYDLFNKYKSDYQVDKILSGQTSTEIKERAQLARFDERLTLLGLLLDNLTADFRDVYQTEQTLAELLDILKTMRMELTYPNVDPVLLLGKKIKQLQKKLERGRLASTLSETEAYAYQDAIATLNQMREELVNKRPEDGVEAFELLKTAFDKESKKRKKRADNTKKKLSNVFSFCVEVFAEGQEILILVTELTISYYGAHFISRYGCEEYFAYNEELLFYERQLDISRELEILELE